MEKEKKAEINETINKKIYRKSTKQHRKQKLAPWKCQSSQYFYLGWERREGIEFWSFWKERLCNTRESPHIDRVIGLQVTSTGNYRPISYEPSSTKC